MLLWSVKNTSGASMSLRGPQPRTRPVTPAATSSARHTCVITARFIPPMLRSRGAGPGLGAGLDGVPGAAERRGVGQVQVADGVDGHAVVDGGGGDVDPLGDLGVLVAEQLHAEQPAGGPVAGEPHGDAVAAGIVGLVVVGVGGDGDRVEPGGGGLVVAQS